MSSAARGLAISWIARLIRSRREVLKAGSLIVAFSLTGGARTASAQQQNTIVPDATAKPVALTEVDSFLAIDASGAVTVYSGKVDLGTGVKQETLVPGRLPVLPDRVGDV